MVPNVITFLGFNLILDVAAPSPYSFESHSLAGLAPWMLRVRYRSPLTSIPETLVVGTRPAYMNVEHTNMTFLQIFKDATKTSVWDRLP